MTLKFTRIVVDENIPRDVVEMLRSLSFKEVYWISEHRAGLTDPEVWNTAIRKGAVLLTGDLGFIAQLSKPAAENGPDVLEFSTDGFGKDELRDPNVMSLLVKWFFEYGHHNGKEHTHLHVKGTVRERIESWRIEKRRRERHR